MLPLYAASSFVRRVPCVVAFEPSAIIVPANILRWYVSFDQAAIGLVRQSDVRLEGSDGEECPRPFVEFGQELWSPDGRRMTLLLDPGRVKRDVKGLGDGASILESGLRYRWRCNDAVWNFSVGMAMRKRLEPELWSLQTPAGPLAPLRIFFDRVMDSALLASQIWIETADGYPTEGEVMITGGGRCWSFTPSDPWRHCEYRVDFGDTLEDVCGNRLSGPLDYDARVGTQRRQQRVCLLFRMAGQEADRFQPAQS